jgi:predicted permease
MRDFVAYVRRQLPRHAMSLERYDEIVDELASELEARYLALIDRGASDQEAWQGALAQVPSWSRLADDLERARAPRLEAWKREFVFALRMLRKDRGFATTAILTLAVCLGGHAAIVTAVNAMLLHPLRVPAPDRVMLMANQYPRVQRQPGTRSSTPDYGDRLRHVTVFEEQAFYNFYSASVEAGGVPTRIAGMTATPSLFRLLRVNPAHGRIFTDEEGTPGRDSSVILTDGLWRELFNADRSAIGRTLRIGGREFAIVGVLRSDFSFGDPNGRLWVPLALTESQQSDEARHRNGPFSLGRLKPEATIEQAREQLKAMDAVNFARMPPRLQSILTNTGFYTGVEPLQDVLVRDVRGPLSLLWAAAFAVLAIGVGNLATIALARSRGRSNDWGTRIALGASRFHIVRQMTLEAVVIAIVGAVSAVMLAAWMLSAVRLALPGAARLHVEPTVAGVTLGLGLLAGVLIGLVASLPLLTLKLGTMVHDGVRGSTPGRTVRRTWRALVVAQMTCSFLLLMGAGLLWVSLRNLLNLDPGFRTSDVISGVVSLSGPQYQSDDAAREFVRRSLTAIRVLPGVEAAGVTTIVPMTASGQTGVVIAQDYVPAPGEPAVSATRSNVTSGYFEAVGTPLIRGRYLDARDDNPSSRSIVIDERLARRFWPDGDAVGRQIFCPMNSTQLAAIDANTPWLTVVGVVRTARLHGVTVSEDASGTSGGAYYVPYAVAARRDVGFVIRSDRESNGVVREVRSALAGVDREVPLFDARTLAERADLALSPRTNTMRLAMLFAAVGVFLSALGLYGMLAYFVAQRTREIGVRLAVGGAPWTIVGLVLREGLWLAVGGIVLGAASALWLGRVLTSHLYGIAPSDPRVLLAMALVLAGIATLACVIPARRAAHVDVMRTLTAP